MAVIGAHDMTYLGRATAIRFITKINGTHELSFQMPDKFFDSELGDFVLNEFNDYVVNENKVKLFYKDQWFELYVKNVKETKHYKSYMKSYTCTDAFIDELSRNGYGITFDTELYNNVEEIGIFSDEILEDSQWEYKPENNWGDFTEYLEEKLFKIPVGQFKKIQGYKLEFDCNSDSEIVNRFTGEKRGLQLGDDLARKKKWFWDCYYSDTNIPLTENKIDVPNDGYIYVPYSQLTFCYETTGENKESTENNFITSTEEPVVRKWDNKIESILLVPTTIDPSALIEFIAIPSGAEIEVDEAGLIVNKNYHYVMTVEDWTNNVNTTWWYTQDNESDISKDYKKQFYDNKPSGNEQFFRKPVVYDGYLTKINDLEIENGKKISISDRTEVNISEEIDEYVKVYNNKGEEYFDLYTNPEEWKGSKTNKAAYNKYRVCSATKTRQIVPQLARNYFENAVDIQSTNGWEIMELKEVPPGSKETSASLELQWTEEQVQEGGETVDEIKKATLNFIHSQKATNSYSQNTIINFGAIGQEKEIKKGQVYCFGIETDESTPIPEWPHDYYETCYLIIGKGKINSNGNYEIDGFSIGDHGPTFDAKKVIKVSLRSGAKQYCLFRSNINIENPYLGLYFVNVDKPDTEEIDPIRICNVWLFEAYTKGIDQFTKENEAYYKYSGRDYVLEGEEDIEEIGGDFGRPKYIGITDITWFSEENIHQRVIFETDIMRGDTYGYQKYFIQQLAINGQGIDTFAHNKYLSEDGYTEEMKLPLSSQKYTEDDYKIVTNYIDLNKCGNYDPYATASECDCKIDGDFNKICMYQKYGYCPYQFQTEKHCRKIRTLNGSKSNRFNLTQELGKVFEVYPQYYVEHNTNGSIKLDGNRPIKDLFYITEKGLENKIGFRYEKNLSDISRTIVSDQIVTKLYVEDNDSELSKTGMCSIKTAEDNPSKDNFIIDLSYYIKQGMLQQDQVYKDLYGTDNKEKGYLNQLGYNNTEYDRLSNKIINLTNESFTELQANVQTNLTGIETVLKEIAKIRKQMARYETKWPETTTEEKEQNDTYKNYVTKLKVQKARLTSLMYDTLYTDGKCDDDARLPKVLINDKGIDYFIKDFNEEHKVTTGMLGQYNKQYKQIQIWKKQRAAYLKKINDISSEFFKYYEPYLKEGTWTDSNYLTDNAYYHDAVQVAAEGAIPKVSYDIKVVPLGILDEDYEMGIADTTYIEDIGMFGINQKTGLPNRLKVIISELNESLDKPNEDSISVQNFTTQFEDLFQQVTSSVQSLTFNENIYKRSSNFTSNQNIETDSLQGTLDTNDLTLLNTQEQNIKLDASGQSGSDINNHNNKYDLNGQGLFFSNNGGESWNIGVGPDGINADYINTGTLDAGNIRIVDNDYIYFLWDKGGITAYRTPQDKNSTFGIDFARFNKYGLSLVESNKIRLRAGYEYKDTYQPEPGEQDDKNKHGFIYKEEQVINEQNIGFYLYNNSGEIIFKTEAIPNDNEQNNSARISLIGEMYVKSKLNDSVINGYKYFKEYKFQNVNYYEVKLHADIQHSSVTPETNRINILKNKVLVKNQKVYHINNKYYCFLSEENDTCYEILKYGTPKQMKQLNSIDTSSSTQSENLNNKTEFIYIDQEDRQKTFVGYKVNNKYYSEATPQYNEQVSDNGGISIYINNQSLKDENAQTKDGNTFYKRLTSYIKTDNNVNSNIFSILSNGSLYIGGKAHPYDENKASSDNFDDYIYIERDPQGNSLELTADGHIFIGETDLMSYIDGQVNKVMDELGKQKLIKHSHEISNVDFQAKNLPKTIESYKTTFEYTNDINFSIDTNLHNIDFDSFDNCWIAISNSAPNYEQGSGSITIKYSQLTWIKLNDFLNILTIKGRTEDAGSKSESRSYSNNQWLVSKAWDVVEAYYNNGLTVYDDSHSVHVDLAVKDKHVLARRDCSGLVSAIFQYLGDYEYGNVNYTGGYLNDMPDNWTATPITMSTTYADLKPGDVVLRQNGSDAPDGSAHSDGHVEFIVKVDAANNRVQTYGFGDLVSSYNGTWGFSGGSIHWYSWLLRRNTTTDAPITGMPLTREVYEQYASSNDNSNAVNAYFEATLSEQFCGPYPETWDDFLNNWNLRCLAGFVLHETGAWPFGSAALGKMMRATVLCHSYINESLGAAQGTKTFEEWILKGAANAPQSYRDNGDPYDGFGTSTENLFKGWIGSVYMNAGTCYVEDLPSSKLPWVQALYCNFRYPELYGEDLHSGTEEFKQAIIKAVKGIFTENGQYLNSMAAANFIVNFDTTDNRDIGRTINNHYCYLTYRSINSLNGYYTNALE